VKFATWNLARVLPKHVERSAAIGAWLDRVDADVWVLTETHDSVSPGPGFSSVSTEHPDRAGEPGERWATVWSRLPIEPLPPTRDPARAVAAVVRPTHGAPFVVYGTVLPWLGSPWRDVPAHLGRAFRAALMAQLADWVDVVGLFPEGGLFVLGDLNQDLSSVYYYGSGRNRLALLDALESVGLSALTAHPNDPVRAMAWDRASIDHVCVPARIAAHGSPRLEVWPPGPAPDRRLSDHFGVAANLTSMRP
jgi:endonuclease/exonuclease/phosphatase family metal-dependent hydrolase